MPEANAEQQDPLHQPVSRRAAARWMMFFSLLALLLSIGRNLALVPLYLRYIDHDLFNGWLVGGAGLTMFATLDFGLMGALNQRVATAYGSRDRQVLESALGTGAVLVLLIAGCMALLASAFAVVMPNLIGVEASLVLPLRECFLIVAAACAIQVVAVAAGGSLRNLQLPLPAGLASTLGEAAAIGVTLLMLYQGHGLYAVAWGFFTRSACEVLISLLAFLWVIRYRLALRLHWNGSMARGLGKNSVYQFLTALASRTRNGFDAFLIGSILDTQVGGAYALTMRAHDTVRSLSGIFLAGTTAGLAHLYGEGSRERFRQISCFLFQLQVLIAAIGAGGLIALNEPFMRLWVGEGFFSGTVINIALAAGGFVSIVGSLPYDISFVSGHFRAISRLVWIEAVVRMILVLISLYWIGVSGVPISSALTQLGLLFLPFSWMALEIVELSAAEVHKLMVPAIKVAAVSLGLGASIFLVGNIIHTWAGFITMAAAFVVASLVGAWVLQPNLVRALIRRGK